MFAGDGGDEDMVAHSKDAKWLYLFTPHTIPDVAGIAAPDAEYLVKSGNFTSEKLVNMENHDYRLEPNVIFTPDGKWLIFRSNMHGEIHTYAVELARNTCEL
jgi:oligogalacturonide lyase